MKRLEVSGAVRHIYESLGVKRLTQTINHWFGKGKMRCVSIYESACCHTKRTDWKNLY